jgi:flagellar hook-associated protein 2
MAIVRFGGIGSGLDTSSIIDALISQQRKVQIKPIENRIATINDSVDALNELKGLLSTLSDKASVFRTLNGGALSKVVTSSNESVATAAVSNTASTGSYSLTVTSLAKRGSSSFNERYDSSSDVLISGINDLDPEDDRTITVQVGGESVEIVVSSTTTVSDFISQFNSQSTKGRASLINVGTNSTPEYAISISANTEGTELGSVSITGGASVATFVADKTSVSATDAQFTMAGVAGTITRSSNTFSDLISGVTVSLSGTGSTNISVSVDSNTTKANVRDLIEAYNAIIEYVAKNDQITLEQDGSATKPVFGALSDVGVDDSLIDSLRSVIRGTSNESGSVRILADLGITTNRDGTLSFNEDTFDDSVSSNPSGVASLLEKLGEEFGAPATGTLAQYTKFGGLLDITLNQKSESIRNNQQRLSDLEKQLSETEQQLITRYAALERIIGSLQSTQSALAGLLSR